MKKNAQVQTQVFIYIFALVVISLILLFGFKAINSFKKDTERLALVNFQTEIGSFMTSAASEYDSVQQIEINLPTEYKEICFIDKDIQTPIDIPVWPLVKDAVNSGTLDNVFIIKDATEIEQFKIIDVDVKGNYSCFKNTRGKIIITAKGKSRYAEIME